MPPDAVEILCGLGAGGFGEPFRAATDHVLELFEGCLLNAVCGSFLSDTSFLFRQVGKMLKPVKIVPDKWLGMVPNPALGTLFGINGE